MLLNPTSIRARRCVNCFRHNFVVQSEYFKKIDKFNIIYNNFYNELLLQNKSLNRTQSYSLQCYLCHVEMLE